MILTIFTPTYNRAKLLPRLYKSLCIQASKDFEWIIIDDGSSDNTESVIREFIEEGIIKIKYFKIPNGGKYKAINFAVPKASGILFMILDSDDMLFDETVVTTIEQYFKLIENNDKLCGIVGNKHLVNKEIIGSDVDYDILESDFISYREILNISGDKAEVIKTKVLLQFPFPESNEKFCPEGLIFNRIALSYDALYVNCPFMRCEYQPDGLTAAIKRCRSQNPSMFMTYYFEYCKLHKAKYTNKIKRSILYWACFCNSGQIGYSYMIKHFGYTRPLGWMAKKLKLL